jgi:hypothetical protein
MNKLIEKLAHLSTGGFIGAIITILVLLQEDFPLNTMMIMPFVGTICVGVLSAIKSVIVDEHFKIWNLLLPIIGSCMIHIVVIIALLSRV